MTQQLVVTALIVLPTCFAQVLMYRHARRQGLHQTPQARLGMALGISGVVLGSTLGLAGAWFGQMQ